MRRQYLPYIFHGEPDEEATLPKFFQSSVDKKLLYKCSAIVKYESFTMEVEGVPQIVFVMEESPEEASRKRSVKFASVQLDPDIYL